MLGFHLQRIFSASRYSSLRVRIEGGPCANDYKEHCADENTPGPEGGGFRFQNRATWTILRRLTPLENPREGGGGGFSNVRGQGAQGMRSTLDTEPCCEPQQPAHGSKPPTMAESGFSN